MEREYLKSELICRKVFIMHWVWLLNYLAIAGLGYFLFKKMFAFEENYWFFRIVGILCFVGACYEIVEAGRTAQYMVMELPSMMVRPTMTDLINSYVRTFLYFAMSYGMVLCMELLERSKNRKPCEDLAYQKFRETLKKHK